MDRWFGSLLAWLAVLAGAAALAADAPSALRLREGRVLADSGDRPPDAADPRWEPVSLPDRWPERHVDAAFRWYRLEFPGPAPASERWAVLLPRLEGIGERSSVSVRSDNYRFGQLPTGRGDQAPHRASSRRPR